MQWPPGVKATLENPIPVITDKCLQLVPLLFKLFEVISKVSMKAFENATNPDFRLRDANDGAHKYSRNDPEKESRERDAVNLEVSQNCRVAIV